jgi:CheY-like chemotaxis protein
MARVLVIDDKPEDVDFVRDSLVPDKHEVIHLSSFVRLPRVLAKSPPDVVVIDLYATGVDARSCMRKLRAHEASEIPVVAYSNQPKHVLEAAVDELKLFGHARKGSGAEPLRWVINRALLRTVMGKLSAGAPPERHNVPASGVVTWPPQES